MLTYGLLCLSPPPYNPLLASCSRSLDEGGAAQAWWLALKFPRFSTSADPRLAAGEAHLLTRASEYNPITGTGPSELSYSALKLSDKGTAMGKTLAQLFAVKTNSAYAYFAYNDDTPADVTSSYYAHAKGVMLVNAEGAFWILHSMPSFVDTGLRCEFMSTHGY